MIRTVLAALLATTAAAHAQDRQAIDRLLSALRSAGTEPEAAMIETRVRAAWTEAGSPAALLLMARGLRDQQAGADQDALEDFDGVVALEPTLPEPWRRRAEARFQLGDADGAVADIGEALLREPRNFAALQDLSRFAEARKDWNGALAAWTKLLEIDPKTPGGETRLADLRRRAQGDNI